MKPRSIVDYLETLVLSGGDHDGCSFQVLPWERRFVMGAFGQPGDAALTVARGDGKSALVAGLACAVVDPAGPLHGRRRNVDCFASSFDQSRVIFEDVLHFLDAKHDLTNRKIWRRADSANNAWIEYRPSGARARCRGADPSKAHGLRSWLALLDEPAQWDTAKRYRMLQAVRTGLGKSPGSRLIALGTRPATADHWFARLLKTAGYAQAHAARPDDPPFHVRTIRRANPSWEHLPSLRARILLEIADARRDPDALASFKALRLNMGTMETEVALLVDADLWARIEGDAPRQGRCVWGADLGTSAASSAVAAYWPASGRLECVAAFPGVPTLAERGLSDGCGSLYVRCAERKELLQTGGQAVALGPLFAEALRRFGPPVAIAADRWRIDEAHDALADAGVPFCQLVERGQGYRDGGEDLRQFRRSCLDGAVTPRPSLLLRSALMEARASRPDDAGNVKLSKGSASGRRMRARDDAAAAAILAVSLGGRMPKQAPRRVPRTAIAR